MNALAPKMPSDIELEQGLLGACIADNAVIDEVFSACEPADFFCEPHPALAAAICHLHADGLPVTPLTLKAKIGSVCDEIGGHRYFASLAAASPSWGISTMARQLAELRVRREAISACMDGAEALVRLDVPVLSGLQAAIETADKASALFGRHRHLPVIETIDRVLAQAEKASHGQPQPFVPTGSERLDAALGGLQGADLAIYAGRPGMGKAQPLDAKVLRKDGTWTTIGDLKIGEDLASIDGASSKVAAIYPRGVRQVFFVKFSDGRKTEACAEHLWEVKYREWPSARVLTTEKLSEMLDRKRYKKRLFIRRISGHFGHTDALAVDPYLLGVLIGDGGITQQSIILTSADQELVDAVADVMPASMEIRKRGSSARYAYSLKMRPGSFAGIRPVDRENELKGSLLTLGLWGKRSEHKFVPPQYLSASRHARLEILRGLMDTDGWAEKEGAVRFCTTSQQLALDVQYLVRSLGAQCDIAGRQTSCTVRGKKTLGLPSFVCKIRHENAQEFFRLSRKSARAKRGHNATISLTVESITPSRCVETRCIRVTHPSHLYVTDDFIVTHNSTVMLRTALAAVLAGRPAIVFSLEMTTAQCLHRIGCDLDYDFNPHNPLSYSWFRGRPGPEDVGRLAEALRQVPGLLEIRDQGDLTIQEIAALARGFAAKHADRLGVVILDYLQKVSPSDRYRGSKVQEVTEISGACKALAKRLGWPVVAGAQLSRGVESRDDKRPTLSDLRESGAIEQDADSVIGLYRPGYYVAKHKPASPHDPKFAEWQAEFDDKKNILEAIILKNRHGAEDVLDLHCEMRASAIRDRRPEGAI